MSAEEMINNAASWIVAQGVTFLINLLVAVAILFVGKFLVSFLCSLVKKSLKKAKKLNDLLIGFVINVLSKVLWVFLWVIALSQIGIDVVPMIVGLGVVGFIAGFAFQDSLSNFAAGFMIMLNEPFQKGDFIDAAGHAGTVTDIHLMATVLTTPDNRKITIPNGKIWGESIINVTANATRRVDMSVGISYSSDISKARDVIKGLLEADERVLKDPAPVVEVVAMADSSVNFVIRPWSKKEDYWGLFFDMQQKIKEALDKNDIEIPFPQMVVHKAE